MEKFREYIAEDSIAERLVFVLIVIAVVLLLNFILKKILGRMFSRHFDRSAMPLVSALFQGALWIIGLLIVLHIFKVNTSGIVAAIGAASLAIGLALKDTLSNVASGSLLLILGPFKAGDFIECGSIKGKVDGIGLFNTTFETPDGLFVSTPNSTLWGAPIINYSRNPVRRLDLSVGVSYDASLDEVVGILRQMVEDEPLFLKNPGSKIFVDELADSSVNICVRVWVKNGDYHDLRRKYLGLIKTTFDEKGIEIPFPQQVVHVKN